MTAVDRATLKTYFITNSRPTQTQFENLVDSPLIICASGGAAIHSSASFFSGTGISIAQSGSSITVTATGGVGGGSDFVTGSFTGSVYIGGAASVGGSALVSGSFIAGGAASIATCLIVNGAASIGASLLVSGSLVVGGTGASFAGSTITVGTARVSSSMLVSGSFVTAGAASIAGSLIVTGATIHTGSLLQSGSLITGGAASIAGSMIVMGAGRFSSSVLVSGSFIAGGATCIAGSAYIKGNKLGVNQDPTAASEVTWGLVLRMNASQNSILSFRNDETSHGFTDLFDSNMFAEVRPAACPAGGMNFRGISSSTAAINFTGNGTLADTGRSTGALGYFVLRANKLSGATQGAPGANENVLVVRSGTSAKFIFDSDGDFHADAAVSASAYDAYDDVGLIRSLEVERVPDLREQFGDWVRYNKADMERLKLASFADGGLFVNYAGMVRLHSGAIVQVGGSTLRNIQEIDEIQERLAEVERLLRPPGGKPHG